MNLSKVCARLRAKSVKKKAVLATALYRDFEKENTYSVIGEWRTRPAMEKHFKTQDFEVMIGAARVLGETFEMNIAEVFETGGFKLVREHIASQDKVRGVPG